MLIGWMLLATATGVILIGMARRGQPANRAWGLVLGLLVLYVITRIPVAGALIWFIGLSFGLGALTLALVRVGRGASPRTTLPAASQPMVPVAPAVP
jgi:hypothetical protein